MNTNSPNVFIFLYRCLTRVQPDLIRLLVALLSLYDNGLTAGDLCYGVGQRSRAFGPTTILLHPAKSLQICSVLYFFQRRLFTVTLWLVLVSTYSKTTVIENILG